MAFSPDGKRIVSGSYGQDGEGVGCRQGHRNRSPSRDTQARVTSVAFSPDGKRIVSGSDDNTVKVWDADNGPETLTLKGHTDMVTSVAFSADGKRIVSGSEDNTVKVWDADKGSETSPSRGTQSLSPAWRSAPTANASSAAARTAR